MQRIGNALYRIFLVASLFIGSSQICMAQVEARIYEDTLGQTMPYRILIPEGYDSEKKYPLVLCLHGAAARGSDNSGKGVVAFAKLASKEVQERYPSFLLVPQCPLGKWWVNIGERRGNYPSDEIAESDELALVREILRAVEGEFSIDTQRIYVTGQSMGGYATFDLITRYPHRFAAAVPVCGGADLDAVGSFAHVPLWNFHGALDKTEPVEGSRKIMAALKAVGSQARYTEYPDVAHNAWLNAWREELGLIPWLFSQRLPPASGQ